MVAAGLQKRRDEAKHPLDETRPRRCDRASAALQSMLSRICFDIQRASGPVFAATPPRGRATSLPPIRGGPSVGYRPAPAVPPERTDMAKILIVDDEESDRLIAQAILVRAGHETVFAHDGEEALRQYALQEIDLVLTDLHMPQIHGFELISVLRDFRKRPALVVMSATGSVQLDMAQALGAKYTIQKPLDPRRLVDTVEQALADADERRAGPARFEHEDDASA